MVWTDKKARIAEIPEWVDRFLGVYEHPTPIQAAIKDIAIDIIKNWERSHEES